MNKKEIKDINDTLGCKKGKSIKEQLEDLYFSGDCENCQENQKAIKKILNTEDNNKKQKGVKKK